MKKICLLILLSALLFNCQNDSDTTQDILNYIPENTSLVIKTNSLESLKSSINNNSLLKELGIYNQVKSFNQYLFPTKHIKPSEALYVCLSKDIKDSLEVSFMTYNSNLVFELDSIPNFIAEKFSSKNKTITKLNVNKKIFYSTTIDSILFISNRLRLVENAFNSTQYDSELKKLLNASNPEKSVSILLNLKQEGFSPKIFNNSELNTVKLSNHLLLDCDFSQNDIILNGITKASDSIESLINVFKGTIPQENEIATIIPRNSDYFLSLTFNNVKLFEANLLKHKKTDSITIANNDHLFETIIEAGMVSYNNENAIILRSLDAFNTQENLSQSLNKTFRSVAIYNFEKQEVLAKIFEPFIANINATYYFNIDDAFVFSNSMSFLETIISNYQNGNTLAENENFKNMMLNLSDESSIFIYVNDRELNNVINTNFNDDKNLNLSQYKTSALQFIYDTDYAHVNAVIKTQKSQQKNNTISEEKTINIDNLILSDIQLVSNHTNNQKDILAQDIDHNLYLISNQGKIFWKKQLNEKILGNVSQIDMYKNGRLQLAFCTTKSIYVLDRNGKDVSPFPLKFNDKITQPLSVFDYDKKRNYRLMVSQGKKVLMYDQRGKIVTGFTYKSAKSNIKTQPKHFRIGKKDYIVFADGNTLEILDRTGRRRVHVKEKIEFSKNNIYLYKNKFTTTNNSGELLQVNTKGSIAHSNLNLDENHTITTTNKTLVTLTDNKLTIKTNTIDLDFGDYTQPKIFYINDKIYISVTDLQAKKVYLFDSQAKLINNFPVYGNSSIEMDDVDNDNALEVIVKGDNNTIIIYEIK
ncbi:ribonuclease HII [uncultured Psychroserpens sp.]|uniref:ribonuclease HII n=1 Tax=uncultured Psychroserpens sp. TaxID=255436 RepID=UPI0026300577|nr:ribonuclease HII [uncultured Psychroserpens sp.]